MIVVLVFSEPVTVAVSRGVPSLTLTADGEAVQAGYRGGSARELRFDGRCPTAGTRSRRRRSRPTASFSTEPESGTAPAGTRTGSTRDRRMRRISDVDPDFRLQHPLIPNPKNQRNAGGLGSAAPRRGQRNADEPVRMGAGPPHEPPTPPAGQRVDHRRMHRALCRTVGAAITADCI